MSQIYKPGTGGGGGAVNSVSGNNGVSASPTTGSVVVSGVNATTSSVGVASFNPLNFSVTGAGQVSLINTWVDKSISFTATSETNYFCESTLTATLPSSPSQGDTIIFYVDSGTTTIQASGTQTLNIGHSSSAVGGTALNTSDGDTVTLVYRSTSNKWVEISSTGSWTLS